MVLQATGKKAISVDIKYYVYLEKSGKANNRSISGQANWVFRVMLELQEHHKEIYTKIVEKLADS